MKMGEEEKRPLIERIKQKAIEQKTYGGDFVKEEAKLIIRDCPHCGAARSRQDGLTHCAYCGFEFISVKLTDGIHIKKEDNSQHI